VGTAKNSVLIIEDDAMSITALVHILGEVYTISAEKDGLRCLGLAKKLQPDLILLDIMMPEISGFDVIKALKDDAETKNIPVIFVTGKNDPEDEVQGFSLGAVDYINKPFSKDVVKARIEHQMQIINLKKKERKFEKKLFEQELNERVRIMLDYAPLMIQYWNKKHDCIDCNQMALDFYGFRTKEEHFAGLHGVLPECQPDGTPSWDCWYAFLTKVFKEGYGRTDFVEKSIEGEPVLFDVVGLRTGIKKEMVVLTYSTDVTQLRASEEKERKALKDEQAANRAKSNFLATMSHEIRTPMNAIVGMSSIGKSADNIERKDYALEKIEVASKFLMRVINDVLDMSKIEAGKLRLAHQPFNLKSTLQKVLTINHFQLEEKKQLLSINSGEDIPELLLGDEQRLTQVLSNLVSNAIKCSPENKEIRLEVQVISQNSSNCTLKFDIIDRGFGISPEQHSMIFEPYFQVENAASHEYAGTGLGLNICKHIVELMGGQIWVESTPGEGATFSFTVNAQLFREEEDVPDTVGRYTANHADGEQKLDLSGKCILLVEDVETNRNVFMMHMESTGAAIEFAENGAIALDMFMESPDKYDLIFMDVLMPVMDGFEATQRIRGMELPMTGKIPIIAMTANVFQEDIDKCFAVGMNAHLCKPFDTDALMNVIKKYLR